MKSGTVAGSEGYLRKAGVKASAFFIFQGSGGFIPLRNLPFNAPGRGQHRLQRPNFFWMEGTRMKVRTFYGNVVSRERQGTI